MDINHSSLITDSEPIYDTHLLIQRAHLSLIPIFLRRNALVFYMGGDKYAERWAGRIDDVAVWDSALPRGAVVALARGMGNPSINKFCYGCGNSLLSATCSYCSQVNPHYARFCGSCGHKLGAKE
jgi:hypothetical protein